MQEVQIDARLDLHQSCQNRRTSAPRRFNLLVLVDCCSVSAGLPLTNRVVTQKPLMAMQVISLCDNQCRHLR